MEPRHAVSESSLDERVNADHSMSERSDVSPLEVRFGSVDGLGRQ
jgi:hypothetical protein